MSQTKQTRSLPLGYEGDAPKSATTVYRLNFHDKNGGQALSNEDRPGGRPLLPGGPLALGRNRTLRGDEPIVRRIGETGPGLTSFVG
jgi:hypothetical protein